MKKKKDERMSHFKRKNKKLKNEKDERVTINIGIMRYVEEESILKPQRGKRLPIRLPKTADSEEVLKLAVAKQSLHNGNEIVNSSVKSYKLLYPDGTEVKQLKECDEAFSLQGYKAELGKPFNRLTLYLCDSSEYLDYTLKGLGDVISSGSASECDSDKDFEDLGEPVQSKITKYTHTSSVVSNTETIPSDLPGPVPITTSSVSGGISVHECNASGSGVISSNNPSHPGCSASVSSSFDAEYQNKNSGFATLKEIFPQLPDRKIYEVFSDSQDIESAIAKLCEDANAGSCDLLQSYASVIDVTDTYDVDDDDISLSNDGSGSLKIVESDKYTMENEQDICTKLGELFQQCNTSGNKIRLKVRRSCLWEDTLAKMKRVNPDCLNGIVTVQFIGEPAVDEGGPRKELFFLVHKYMQQSSSLFTGPPTSRRLVHNMIALQKEEYLHYGVISALSLYQGSPGPTMFAAPVVDYILYGKLNAVKVSVSDLTSGKVKTTLEELEAISDPVKFKQEASFNTPLRFKAGYTKPIVAFEDKEEFIRCICLHQLILTTQSEIDQFTKGLMTNGILDVIRSNPDKSRKLLQHDDNERLTAEIVDSQFHYIFSDQGSNKRASEEAIAFNFSHYLEDVEQGLVTSNVKDPDTEEIHTSKVNLAHVLQFVTGCDAILVIGFDTSLTIMFDHNEPHRKLTANTCSCTLNFPVCDLLTNYESF